LHLEPAVTEVKVKTLDRLQQRLEPGRYYARGKIPDLTSVLYGSYKSDWEIQSPYHFSGDVTENTANYWVTDL